MAALLVFPDKTQGIKESLSASSNTSRVKRCAVYVMRLQRVKEGEGETFSTMDSSVITPQSLIRSQLFNILIRIWKSHF